MEETGLLGDDVERKSDNGARHGVEVHAVDGNGAARQVNRSC